MEFVVLSSMHINYILHILLRSSKFLGVLIFNFIVKSKENKITKKDLVFGAVFTMGVIIFSFSGSKKNEQSTTTYGLFCALTAFFLDGAVSYYQGKTRNVNMPSVSSFCFMQMTNFWCLLASVIYSLMKNSLFKGFLTLLEHPDVFLIMITMGCLSVVGQFFIFDHLNRFGPISISLIGTMRKIFSIVFSIVIYRHPLTTVRYIGLSIIVCVLASKSFGFQLVNWVKRKLRSGTKQKQK
jgi:drug/metabolite transporter (DMT)-like permease